MARGLIGFLSRVALITAVMTVAPGAVLAQDTQDSSSQGGRSLPDSEKLKMQVDLLLGWSYDGGNEKNGFENQGRVGYATVTLFGKIHPRVGYRVSINPVNEVEPVPGCGMPDYFFPNQPAFLYPAGPAIPCDPKDGNRRVDGYRGIALDVVRQQGPIREAYVTFDVAGPLEMRVGRMRLPLGFDWEEAGSTSAKDAPRLQRINAETSFGAMARFHWGATGRTRPLVSASLAGVLGEGNRWWDYDYFFFENGSLDSNSALTTVGQVTLAPVKTLQFRLSGKAGFTGSKLETYPSYWASKRNDQALIAGAEWAPSPYARLLGEWARYTWGPTKTSAELVGVDTAPIRKAGYWVTAEGSYPIGHNLRLGASVTQERVDRADSLVKFMASRHLFGVTEGKSDQLNVLRVFADIGRLVRISVFRSDDTNPYPWLSGMWPVSGDHAYAGREPDRYGGMVRVRVH